jgi:DHA3 family tetracycline resistance protein-like MFS transporter
MRRYLQPATVYLLSEGAWAFLFALMSTVFAVFLIVELDLSAFRLVILGTILEVTYLLFEVPTGVVADTVSRRLSVLIGIFGTGVAFFILGLSNAFWIAAASQVMWGFFATFVSGADVAWLTDEVGEAEARKLYLKAEQVGHITALLGIASSVALASIALPLPILVSGLGFVVLGVVLTVVMPERNFRKPERATGERAHQAFGKTLRHGIGQVRAHHVLLLIFGTAALHGASTEGFDRLSDLHLLRDIGLPPLGDLNRVVWFGILDGVALVLGLGAITLVKRRTHLEGHAHVARILAVVDVLLIGSVVIFGLTGSFWMALGAFWIVGALRSVREPVFTAWLNQGLDPATRATVNSMGAQSDAIGQSAGGPLLGLIGNRSVPAALVVSGLLRLPSLLLYARAIKRGTVGTLAPDEIESEIALDKQEPIPPSDRPPAELKEVPG